MLTYAWRISLYCSLCAGVNMRLQDVTLTDLRKMNPCEPKLSHKPRCCTMKDRNDELHSCLNLTYRTRQTGYHITSL